MFSREQMQRAIEDALKQMEGVALELYRRGREEAREELAEANARRGDLRTALEWANEERDRLRKQLAAKHSECPDCADYAARSGRFAEQADQLMRERDLSLFAWESAGMTGRTAQSAMLELARQLDEARAEAERLREECRLRKAERDQVERNGFAATKGLVDESERLRAKALAYDLAYRRGAEAMRDECIGAACGFYMGTTGFCNGDEDDLEAVLEALPIPEEPTNG